MGTGRVWPSNGIVPATYYYQTSNGHGIVDYRNVYLLVAATLVCPVLAATNAV